jgi:hypothetical protein
MYGFNSLTPLDLILLPIDKRGSLDDNIKAHIVKDLHENIKQ